jgi:hypothetical protein
LDVAITTVASPPSGLFGGSGTFTCSCLTDLFFEILADWRKYKLKLKQPLSGAIWCKPQTVGFLYTNLSSPSGNVVPGSISSKEHRRLADSADESTDLRMSAAFQY